MFLRICLSHNQTNARIPKYLFAKSEIKIDQSNHKKVGKANFIRAKIMDDGIVELEKQDSNMLRSFAEADGFIYLDKDIEIVKQHQEVEVHLLPFIK